MLKVSLRNIDTVDGIMADFEDKIADLERVEASRRESAASRASRVREIEAQIVVDENEARRAKNTADKLRALVG